MKFLINAHDEGFTLSTHPEIEMEIFHFGNLVSLISEKLQWKHPGVERKLEWRRLEGHIFPTQSGDKDETLFKREG